MQGLLVFDLLSGAKLKTLTGHLAEVICATAATADARVFTGGADSVIHAWTPPPCGLSRPAVTENPLPPEAREGDHVEAARFDSSLAALLLSPRQAAREPPAPGSVLPSASFATGPPTGQRRPPSPPRQAEHRAPSTAPAARAATQRVFEDEDAWSDDEDDEPAASAPSVRRRPMAGARKRVRE